jgi:CO/xanthine dehydrogenase Mo-binding subunit
LQTRVVGTSVPRKEGPAKLTGQARYIDDLSFPGMIFGATVRWQHGEAQ